VWQSNGSHGWELTRDELGYDRASRTWRPIPAASRGASKPGLTSVRRGDTVHLLIDTTFKASGEGASEAGEGQRRRPVLQLTYLQSYEQTGILSIACASGCTCTPQRLDTLMPSRLATLNTTVWHVSPSRVCLLRFTNVSPEDGTCRDDTVRTQKNSSAAAGPCSKIKLVALAVGGATADSGNGAAKLGAAGARGRAELASSHVENAIDLNFI
jgi:hypothetical protein